MDHHRSYPAQLLFYFGVIATGLAVATLALIVIVQESAGLSTASAREKTLLEVQTESSREIRRALATPITIPPLPPITARPAREFRNAAASPKASRLTKLSSEALDAMAMDQGGGVRPSGHDYPVSDRHTSF